jgi:hypothetical protein
LGERVVTTDTVDASVKVGILGKLACYRAEFLSANSSESHRNEEKEDISFANFFAELYHLGTVLTKCGEFKIGCLRAY